MTDDEFPTAITVSDIRQQRVWSRDTFGPGERLKGVLKHIHKELDEVFREPKDPIEWADLIVLAIDGATRQGIDPADLIEAYHAKMQLNYAREWPDWRESSEDEPIEHIKEPGEAPLVLTQKEVAGILQVHERTVERMVRKGALSKVRGLGTAVRIPREQVQALIAGSMSSREPHVELEKPDWALWGPDVDSDT